MDLYDFNQIIDRKASNSVRWDKYPADTIPLWVADMDFQSPPCVIDALKERVSHGIYGYTHSPAEMKANIAQYLMDQYHWQVDPEWIEIIPSIVSSLYSIAKHCTSRDGHILTLKPVYHHIFNAAKNSGRAFDEVELQSNDQRLTLDTKSINSKQRGNSELLFFCNPHNPGGTVYQKHELTEIAEYCQAHNLVICSDEIHCGMVYEGHQHTPIASLSEDAADRTITLMSLNKTFNFPGAGLAWLICKNASLRKRAVHEIGTVVPDPQLFSYVTTQAALDSGEPWRRALIQYLADNRNLLMQALANSEKLKLYRMEASYLGWVSCVALKMNDPSQLFLKYGVALQPGYMFNQPDHVRINIATPRPILEEALQRMQNALKAV